VLGNEAQAEVLKEILRICFRRFCAVLISFFADCVELN
jgi:hypothetical protein